MSSDSSLDYTQTAKVNKNTRKAERKKSRFSKLFRSLYRQVAEHPTIDGKNNNIVNPEWGTVDIPLVRVSNDDYFDGKSFPSGSDRPNPRMISNMCMQRLETNLNSHKISNLFWQWGQFIDHDLDLSVEATPKEPFNISVPAEDVHFDPFGSGDKEISLSRSAYKIINGRREQTNQVTAFLDGSMVYGSDLKRARELRVLDGSGRLKTSYGNLLPFNINAFPNGPAAHLRHFYLAGDVRVNEQVGLIAIHTLFVREHNYWAKQIARNMPRLDEDEIYEMARSIVSAEIQAITYNEFLSMLLGKHALGEYQGYNPNINPGIANEFSTAAFRVGHTMLVSKVARLNKKGRELPSGHLSLKDAFFNPKAISQYGIEPYLRGLFSLQAEEIDTQVIDDVRNFLFGAPGQGGLDLVSLNIQRGREHGLPDYNTVRQAYGLPRKNSFSEITSNLAVATKLKQAYLSVNKLDLWVAGLAEDHYESAMVGETFYTIIKDQFQRLRHGDRFWYENNFSNRMVNFINKQTLATIIARNTSIGEHMQKEVMQMSDAN